jgi:hypothetical protein
MPDKSTQEQLISFFEYLEEIYLEQLYDQDSELNAHDKDMYI